MQTIALPADLPRANLEAPIGARKMRYAHSCSSQRISAFDLHLAC
jgi:hypothetical protein